jgi:Flp pilus assembly protein TadG
VPLNRRHRRAAVAVEGAIAYSAMFLLLLLLIAGGLGVFHYQQVAMLAQEAARTASVQGSNYQAQTGQPSPTQQQILQNVVQPLAANMDLTQLAIAVDWIDGTNGTVVAWDSSSKTPRKADPTTGAAVNNRVRVTITYKWSPAFFVQSPLTLQCVAEQPMSF